MLRYLLIGVLLCLVTAATLPRYLASASPRAATRAPGDDREKTNGHGCGVERWAIKTGTDADAAGIDTAHPRLTTLSDLTHQVAPRHLSPTHRSAPVEMTSWIVNATLVRYREEPDSDYHLVLRSGSGGTMIAEIPSPRCVDQGSPFYKAIGQARRGFNTRMRVTRSFKRSRMTIAVTGLGFFDDVHGQSGVAPNGIELHPVLAIQFHSVTATSTPTATPTATSTPTLTPTATSTPTPFPTATATARPTATPYPTAIPYPTPTPVPAYGPPPSGGCVPKEGDDDNDDHGKPASPNDHDGCP